MNYHQSPIELLLVSNDIHLSIYDKFYNSGENKSIKYKKINNMHFIKKI